MTINPLLLNWLRSVATGVDSILLKHDFDAWLAAGAALSDETSGRRYVLVEKGKTPYETALERIEELERRATVSEANWEKRIGASRVRETELHRRLVEAQRAPCAGRADIVHATSELWETLADEKRTRNRALEEAAILMVEVYGDGGHDAAARIRERKTP